MRKCLATALHLGTSILLFFASEDFATGTDWPNWGGPARDGRSSETGLNWNWPVEGPPVVWKASLGKGFSCFSVVASRAYCLGNKDNQDTVVALDSKSGKELWKYTYACELDPKAFEGGPLSTPTVDGSRVYTLSKLGHCYCFDATTGAVIWSRKFTPPVLTKADYHVWWGFAGSMVISQQRLIVPAGPAAVCLDKITGDVLWDNGPGHPGYSTPVLFKSGSRDRFALVSGHEIVAADVQTGKVFWKTPWKTTWDQNASDVLVSDGRMFVSSGHGVGAASFDISGDQPVCTWSNKNMRTYLGNCLMWKGLVYGFDDRQLRCLDWVTGEVKWSAPDQGLGTLIIVDDKLVVLTEKGILRVAKATHEAFQTVAEAKVLEGRCWSTPALADGRLYLRNATGDAVCLDLTGRRNLKR